MTPQQVAINARVVRELASMFTGWDLSDPDERAQHVVNELLAWGLAPLPKAEHPRPTGPSSTPETRAQHKAEIDAAIEAARRKRKDEEMLRLASAWQLRQLGDLLWADGMRDKAERLAWASAMVSRELKSAVELTTEEAGLLIVFLRDANSADDTSAEHADDAQPDRP